MTALAAVYNALIEASVSPDSATAAMAALEESRDEPWKRKIERELGQIKVMGGIIIAMLLPLLVKAFWS